MVWVCYSHSCSPPPLCKRRCTSESSAMAFLPLQDMSRRMRQRSQAIHSGTLVRFALSVLSIAFPPYWIITLHAVLWNAMALQKWRLRETGDKGWGSKVWSLCQPLETPRKLSHRVCVLVSFIQCDLQTYQGSVWATFGIMAVLLTTHRRSTLCGSPSSKNLVRCPESKTTMFKTLKAMAEDVIELRLFISTWNLYSKWV